jgi:hypothetical protein
MTKLIVLPDALNAYKLDFSIYGILVSGICYFVFSLLVPDTKTAGDLAEEPAEEVA